MTEVVKIETPGDSAFRAIRSDIIFGHLAPGEKLRLESLKRRYGVSVSTLREILSRLAAENIVLAEGQRGFEVAPMSASDLQQVADLRQLLESHAMEQSFAQGDLDWEARVVAAHYKLSAMERELIEGGLGDDAKTVTWKRFDWEFHQALISACGSEALMRAHASAFDKYLRYQVSTLSFRGQIAADEHKALLDAALKRDARQARKILQVHVSGGVEHALKAGDIK